MMHIRCGVSIFLVVFLTVIVSPGEEIKMRVVDGPPGLTPPAANSEFIHPSRIHQPPVTHLNQRVSLELWGGIGALGGNVTYQIGGAYTVDGEPGYAHFPVSELKWPTDVLMGTIGGSLIIAENFEIITRLSGNLSSDAGMMEDFDWTNEKDPHLLTVYSRSDAVLDTKIVDISGRCWVLNVVFDRHRAWRVGLGCGLLYQDSQWEARNAEQRSIDPSASSGFIPGLAATYDVELTMPYVEISTEWTMPWLSFSGGLAYAPRITLKDEDDHVLRYRLSTTDAEGDAVRFIMQARYDYTDCLYGVIKLDLLTYAADGTEHGITYGGEDAGQTTSVEHEITGLQDQLYIGLGCKF